MLTNNSVCRLLGLALLLTLQACGDPKSSSTSGPDGGPVPTNRMFIDLRAEALDSGTAVVRVNLNDGRATSTSYRLDGGDYLRACVGGVCRNMADNDSIVSPDYIARFDFRPGIDHVVSFHRLEAPSAPDSHVSLPQAFTIVTPADRQQVTDGETVEVAWSPTGTPARASLRYESECTYATGTAFASGALGIDTNADGRESVRIDPIVSAARSNSPSAITRCSIEFIVNHEIQGRIDPAFDGGTAVGVTSRTVTVDYVPR